MKFDSVITTEGFARDECILTRCGVFTYHEDDGTVIREVRLPEHVFAAESLESYEGKDIILTHVTDKAGLVDSENFRDFTIGNIISAQRDGENVRGKLLIKDVEALKNNPHLRELSLAYTRDLIRESGTYNGEQYDCIQSNIKINNLAVVSEARAGENARLNLDEEDKKLDTEKIATVIEEADVKNDAGDVYGKIEALKAKYAEGGEEVDVKAVCELLDVLGDIVGEKPDRKDTELDEAAENPEKEKVKEAFVKVVEYAEKLAEKYYAAEKTSAFDEGVASEPGEEVSVRLDSVDARLDELLSVREAASKIGLDVKGMDMAAAKTAIVKAMNKDVRLDGLHLDTMYRLSVEKINARKPISGQYDGMMRTDGVKPVTSTAKTVQENYENRFYNRKNGGES